MPAEASAISVRGLCLTAAHLFGLSLSPIYEDLDVSKQSLTKISALTFKHACFGHGRPIIGGADKTFRKKFL
jgi:hypothetical protein